MDLRTLQFFVYGTLKRGFRSHHVLQSHVISIWPAEVVGRLYQLPAGYPMIEVPRAEFAQLGSGQLAWDLRAQCEQLSDFEFLEPEASWDLVQGEIVRLAPQQAILNRLDAFEGFDPLGRSLYDRVLILARRRESMPGRDSMHAAWSYVVPKSGLPAGAVRTGPTWPG